MSLRRNEPRLNNVDELLSRAAVIPLKTAARISGQLSLVLVRLVGALFRGSDLRQRDLNS